MFTSGGRYVYTSYCVGSCVSLTRSVHITGNGDGVRAIQIGLVHCIISVVTPEQQTHPVHETANNIRDYVGYIQMKFQANAP